MCEAERCGWVRKAKRSSGLAGRSGGLAGRSGGLAERRLGRAGEAAELCGAAELLGVPLTIRALTMEERDEMFAIAKADEEKKGPNEKDFS